jgi:hypothetical protein
MAMARGAASRVFLHHSLQALVGQSSFIRG